MPRHLLVFACLLSLSTAALVMGCNDGENGGNATATETLEMTATAVATVPPETATPVAAIRREDLTQQPGLREFLSASGGQVDPQSIIYADITGDQEADAIVPVSSGGEGGNIALFIYSYQPSGIEQLLQYTPEMRLQPSVEDGQLTITEPVSAPGDPLCCPSELKKTTYRWDGSKLVVTEERTVPAAGGQKP